MALIPTNSNTNIPTQNLGSSIRKMIYVKEIESGIRFQKTKKFNPEQRLELKNLRFTFCDVNDSTSRPFGNLFTSLHLPVGNVEKKQYRALFTGTALLPLANTSKVVVINIPKDFYGELIDGKSIELKIPVTSNAATGGSSVTCFSTFYGFNPDLNTQVSDQNIISSLFGVNPTSDNEFNTNIAYLFSNDIARPLTSYQTTQPNPVANFVVPANSSIVFPFTVSWLPGQTYNSTLGIANPNFEYEFNTGTTASPTYFPLSNVIEDGIITNDASFKPRVAISGVRITNITSTDESIIVYSQLFTAISEGQWDKWDVTNKYAYSEHSSGKRFANLRDVTNGLLIDIPVGIVYLDKGIVVITDPRIVNNIDTTKFYDDNNGVLPTGIAYTGTGNAFASTYTPNSNDAHMLLKSVSTEYIQSYTCLALQDEFYDTDNPTFTLAYPQGNPDNENVYITEVGLYNASGEMIAIAKTSKPVAKNKNNVAVFRLSIKI